MSCLELVADQPVSYYQVLKSLKGTDPTVVFISLADLSHGGGFLIPLDTFEGRQGTLSPGGQILLPGNVVVENRTQSKGDYFGSMIPSA